MQAKKKLAEKVNSYAKYVREMYWPSVVSEDNTVKGLLKGGEDQSDHSQNRIPPKKRNGTAENRGINLLRNQRLPPHPVAQSINSDPRDNSRSRPQLPKQQYKLKSNLRGGGSNSEPESLPMLEQESKSLLEQ